ncbi:hypothetical protein FSP39_003108 [Pinctada imbricata]|uniref:C1q domain-containing protein n=1 Tax=Pinctada imbricata TaxID=66713 RepID=A0AA88XPG0_PINIB|nr:hypothetical protein FSP39_003108 [Pinctada imbricata]
MGQKSKDIAFYAYMSKDLVNPAQGSTIIFDVAKTNDGGAYDPVHGVFQASINGSYHFQFIGASPENNNPGHIMHVFISKNGMREAYSFLDRNTDHWVQNTAVIVLHLVKGDRVWVEIGQVAGSHMLGGYRSVDNATHTHFSGFLIHAD